MHLIINLTVKGGTHKSEVTNLTPFEEIGTADYVADCNQTAIILECYAKGLRMQAEMVNKLNGL